MEAVGERHDRNTAGVKSGKLQRCLNRIRAGWARELNQIIQFPRLQYDFIKQFDEFNFGNTVQVETRYYSIRS